MSVHQWMKPSLVASTHPIKARHTINLGLMILMMTSTSVRHIWTLARPACRDIRAIRHLQSLGPQRDPLTGISSVSSLRGTLWALKRDNRSAPFRGQRHSRP